MAKTDISFTYMEEAKKINDIFYNVNRTTSGNINWTSTSSGVTYSTSTSSDETIVNCGEAGLMKLIQSTYKGSSGWLMCADDINGKAVRTTYTATITATWTGSTAPYTQEVAISGMLATDAPHITPVYSDTLATALNQKEAWAMVSEADAGAGKIIFTCFEDVPTVAIPILVEVVR